MSKTKAKSTRRRPKQAKGAVITEVVVILVFAVVAVIVALQLFYQPPKVDNVLPLIPIRWSPIQIRLRPTRKARRSSRPLCRRDPPAMRSLWNIFAVRVCIIS